VNRSLIERISLCSSVRLLQHRLSDLHAGLIVEQNQNTSWFDCQSLDCSTSDNFRQLLVSWHVLVARSTCWGISAIKRIQLRHELALLSFSVKPRPRFPIFARARVYPYLTGRRGCGRRLCLSDSWDGLLATYFLYASIQFDAISL
jgi:hypothetical protein